MLCCCFRINPTSKSQPFVPQIPRGPITWNAFSLKQSVELLFSAVVVDILIKVVVFILNKDCDQI